MSHMVIFKKSDGKTGFHQVESVEEAARFVERLRNADGVENVRIFKMEEVAFEYRPYYKVELGDAPAGAGSVEADEASDATPAEATAVVPAPPAEASGQPVEAAPAPAATAEVLSATASGDPLASVPTPVPVPVDAASANGKRSIFNR